MGHTTRRLQAVYSQTMLMLQLCKTTPFAKKYHYNFHTTGHSYEL